MPNCLYLIRRARETQKLLYCNSKRHSKPHEKIMAQFLEEKTSFCTNINNKIRVKEFAKCNA